MRVWILPLLIGGATLAGCSSGPDKDKVVVAEDISIERSRVIAVLDKLHDSAARAALTEYLGCYAPDAIFLGTDATERWNMTEWELFCKHQFVEKGTGWKYKVIGGRRHVFVAQEGKSAWFDEALWNEKYGECRGSGVLRKSLDGWQIVQYNLTMPVPNALAEKVSQMTRELKPAGEKP